MSTLQLQDNITVDDASSAEHIFRISVLSIVTSLIFSTNALIVVTLPYGNEIPYAMKYLMTSLCCTDLVKGILLIMSLVTSGSSGRIFGDVLCMTTAFFANVLYATSLNTLAVMVVNKYLMMRLPLRYYTIITRRVAILTVLLIWVIILLVQITFYFAFRVGSTYNENVYTCTSTFTTGLDAQSAALAVIIAALIPLLTAIVVCNIKMYKMASHHHSRITDVTMTSGDVYRIRNAKGLKTILISCGISLCCLVPSMMFNFEAVVGMAIAPLKTVFTIYTLSQLNSCMSWFVYWNTLLPFRTAQKNMWKHVKSYWMNVTGS